MSSCRPEAIIFDEVRGEYICTETGEVLEEHVFSFGPEWRIHEPGIVDVRVRAGIPITNKVHDHGFHTEIDGKTYWGRKLGRINKEVRAVTSRERKLVRALRLMNDVVGHLNLPNGNLLKNEAGSILQGLSKKGLIKKKNYKRLVAASIILAAEATGTPIDKGLVMTVCEVTTSELWKAMMRIRRDSGIRVRTKPLDPRRFIDKMAAELGVSASTKALAHKIATVAKKDGLTSGKGPRGVAAASLYIASVLLDERKTQREVSEAVDVSEVTIRNRYRDLIDNLMIEVDV